MTHNPTFNKAVHLLSHPASLSALVLLALNDFVLKQTVPSWLTGKLSDFALLFVLPWLGLAVLTWVVPSRWQRFLPAVMFGGIAAGFALLKLFPPAGTVLYAVTSAVGVPLYTRPDASDLLALVVLLPGWFLWRQAAAPRRVSQALVLLPLAALLALADAPAPDYGITCFYLDAGKITSSTVYGTRFVSTDGGLTWQPDTSGGEARPCSGSVEYQAAMSDPEGAVQYRFEPGGVIERSADGGQTWSAAYTPPHFNQVRKAYAEKTVPANISYRPGPLTAVEDPASGNVLFAMGLEGVLVRKPSGEWVWANVGKYSRSPEQPVPVNGYLTLLSGEIFLAIAGAVLAFSTLALRFHQKRAIRIIKVVIGWIGWLGVLLVFSPALMSGAYSAGINGMTLVILSLYALVSLLDDLITLARKQPGAIAPTAGLGVLAGVLFLAPFIGWAAELLPDYTLSAYTGTALIVLVLAAGLVLLRQKRNFQDSRTQG